MSEPTRKGACDCHPDGPRPRCEECEGASVTTVADLTDEHRGWLINVEGASELLDDRDPATIRASKWKPFVLLRTVIEQSPSSLRTEALIVLEQLEERVTDAEKLGDV